MNHFIFKSVSYISIFPILKTKVEDQGENCEQAAQKWSSLEITRGNFDSDQCWGDIAEIKFPLLDF